MEMIIIAPHVDTVGTTSDDTHTVHNPVRDFNKHSEMLDINTPGGNWPEEPAPEETSAPSE